jgi:hypothetical protein
MLRFFDSCQSAFAHHEEINRLSGRHDAYLVDGPEDNFAIVDKETACELQDTETPECLCD